MCFIRTILIIHNNLHSVTNVSDGRKPHRDHEILLTLLFILNDNLDDTFRFYSLYLCCPQFLYPIFLKWYIFYNLSSAAKKCEELSEWILNSLKSFAVANSKQMPIVIHSTGLSVLLKNKIILENVREYKM